MKNKTVILLSFLMLQAFATAHATSNFSKQYCNDPRFTCHKVKPGESWEKLFPDLDQRDLVMRLNRINIALRSGMTIAVPKNIETTSIIDVAPFQAKIDSTGEKQIIVDLNKLAWGAYDQEGNLIHWGPASGGKGYCPDVGQMCRTISGSYKVQRKQPAHCVSSKFPIEWDGGGAYALLHALLRRLCASWLI